MPTGVYPRPLRVCEVDGCGKKHQAKGLCSMHYYRQTKIGSLEDPQNTRWKGRAELPESLTCRTCEVEKPSAAFLFRQRYGVEFYENDCIECAKARTQKWREENAERVARTNKLRKARKDYGEAGVAVAERILAGEPCDACGGKTARMAIDHNHETGEVRGLLCGNCNTALGLLGEDVDRLMSLAAYALTHENVLGKVSP